MTPLLDLARAGRRVNADQSAFAAYKLVSDASMTARYLRRLPPDCQRDYLSALVEIAERGADSPAARKIATLLTSKI